MSESIILHGFGDFDRSGKVRWIAAELGLSVDERRIEPGAHREPPYTTLNPLAQIPTAEFRGRTLIESSAICQLVAESVDEPKLWIGPGEPKRAEYLFWMSAFGENLEGRLVECAVSRMGRLPSEFFTMHEPRLRAKLAAVAKLLPAEGYVCGHFTVADVLAGYSLRLALSCELIDRASIEPYFGRLVAREAATTARFFSRL